MNRKTTNSKAVFQSIKAGLTLSDLDEAHAIALALMEKYYQLSFTSILAEKEVAFIDLSEIINRLNQHEPLQYVLGEADFFERKFKVNSSVLIPRPETEILIEQVLKTNPIPSRILDVGTGSGCIAITLKLEIPSAQVIALDISEKALQIANENSRILGAEIELVQRNFLEDIVMEPVDLIVSNPPYICSQEKSTMSENVLQFEPHLALFVPDNDPLLFYKAIAQKSKSILTRNGKVIAEINEHLGLEVAALFRNSEFKEVQILKDLDRKDRVLVAVK
ncbi:release factor glutamine methyltransferase [Cytophagales bacterium WSM2-2]|nr:release factor glutamine methyltransferase [Cytophagales bacterium WSM2-2]